MSKLTKIVIIDDDEIACRGIKQMVETIENTVVTNLFADAQAALGWLAHNNADLVTVDYHMPKLNGIDFIRQLKNAFPKIKIIILTTEKNPYVLRQILDTNINSLIVKGPYNLLVDAIKAVKNDQTFLQPEFGIPIQQAEKTIQVMRLLTEAQRFCFEKIAEGETIETIARLQNTTANTVKDRLMQCRKKIGVKTTKALIDLYHRFYPK